MSRDQVLKQAAMALPNLIKLVARLLGDPRVAGRYRLVALAALGYVASPIDLLPDFIPVVGQADDLLIVAFTVHLLVRGAGPDVVAEHWDGSDEALDVVDDVLEWTGGLLPRPLRASVERWLG